MDILELRESSKFSGFSLSVPCFLQVFHRFVPGFLYVVNPSEKTDTISQRPPETLENPRENFRKLNLGQQK